MTSIVAQRVLDIEEAGLGNVKGCNDVPVRARISNVSPIFDYDQRKTILTYTRSSIGYDMTRQKIQEVIKW